MEICPKLPLILFDLVYWQLSFLDFCIRRRHIYYLWVMTGIYNYWWHITSFYSSAGRKGTRMFYVSSVVTSSVFSELLWKSTLIVRYKLNSFRPPWIKPVWYLCTIVWSILQVHNVIWNGLIWSLGACLQAVHMCHS